MGFNGQFCTAEISRCTCRFRVKSGGYRTATWPSASPRLTDITDSRVLPAGGRASRPLCAGDACVLERERLQPRYRGLAYAIGPREIGLRSAFCELLDSLLPLAAGQSRRAPKTHATGLGTDTAVAGTSNDQCALELRPPKTVSISRPCAVVVSAQASASDLKPAPASASCCWFCCCRTEFTPSANRRKFSSSSGTLQPLYRETQVSRLVS